MNTSPPSSGRTALMSAVCPLCLLMIMIWSTPLAAQLSAVEIWRVGELDGPPETIWARVSGATTLNGATYVVDMLAPTVRVFDTATGAYRFDVGRSGMGPAEFARPSSAVVVGNEVWISDIIQKRTVVLDSAGSHRRTERWPGGMRGFLMRMRKQWRFGDEWRIGLTSMDNDVGKHYVIAWNGNSVADTLASFDALAFRARVVLTGGRDTGEFMSFTGALGPSGGMWPYNDSTFAIVDGWSSTASLVRMGSSGPLVVSEERIESPRVLRPDSARAVEWWLGRAGIDPSSEVRLLVPPPSLPSWRRVLGDSDGNLWLQEGSADGDFGDEAVRWARWRPGGRSEPQWLELPPGIRILSFNEGVVIGVTTDELGVQRVVAFQIVE